MGLILGGTSTWAKGNVPEKGTKLAEVACHFVRSEGFDSKGNVTRAEQRQDKTEEVLADGAKVIFNHKVETQLAIAELGGTYKCSAKTVVIALPTGLDKEVSMVVIETPSGDLIKSTSSNNSQMFVAIDNASGQLACSCNIK